MNADLQEIADRIQRPAILYVNVYPVCRMPDGHFSCLLLQRRQDVVLPGVWQPVSGKLLAGESILAGFARQMQMKTGVQGAGLKPLEYVNTYFDSHYGTVMMVPAAAAFLRRDVEICLDDALHTGYRWVDLVDIGRYITYPGQLECYRQICCLSDVADQAGSK